jgi:hypothetical protein
LSHLVLVKKTINELFYWRFEENCQFEITQKMLALTGQISNFFSSDLQELAKVANHFKI